MKSAFAVVELPIALQYSLGHSSLTLELVELRVGSSSATLDGSEHSNCYSMRSWGWFCHPGLSVLEYGLFLGGKLFYPT